MYEYTVYESGDECTTITVDSPALEGSTLIIEGYLARVVKVYQAIDVIHIEWVV